MNNKLSSIKLTAYNIFTEAVKAADPYFCVKNFLEIKNDIICIDNKKYPLKEYDKVYIIGGGKASARMALAAEEILGSYITGGWINTKDGHSIGLKRITVHECSHPVPDERGIYGASEIIDILSESDKKSIVICLLSGGGSALMPAPANGITLSEKQEVTRLLLSCGADISEINAVRKHLSVLKGGGMARLAYPAKLHVLILSDVIGDKLDVIASGPAVVDTSDFNDCIDICEKYGIVDSLPVGVLKRFRDGIKGVISETAKSSDSFLSCAENTIIGNNRISVETAAKKSVESGYNTYILSTVFDGEASELGKFYGAVASEIEKSGNPVKKPACIIGGGETTVTIKGKGKGGRNQEAALSAAVYLDSLNDTVFLSGGTDGTDGPTDAAGGIVDCGTVKAGSEKGLNIYRYLKNNDSYNFLKETGGLLVTGPTGTNVMDIQILLSGLPEKAL